MVITIHNREHICIGGIISSNHSQSSDNYMNSISVYNSTFFNNTANISNDNFHGGFGFALNQLDHDFTMLVENCTILQLGYVNNISTSDPDGSFAQGQYISVQNFYNSKYRGTNMGAFFTLNLAGGDLHFTSVNNTYNGCIKSTFGGVAYLVSD